MSDDKQVIALRQLTLDGSATVTVELLAPTPSDQSDDFRCGYRIDGLGASKVRYAYGVDSMQALLLAMQSIAAHLYTSEEAKTGRLQWLGMSNFGLPFADAIADLVPRAADS
jgi:hypothetical protein